MAHDQQQFRALTGIRAIAAFMVFFNHLPLHLNFPFFQYLQAGLSSGVSLFFILSGFLITYRYYNNFSFSEDWFAKYFIRRFARIYPVYFFLVTIVLITSAPHSLGYIVENYTLTHSLFDYGDIAISPSWSLTVEECFYLSAPIIFLLIRKYGLWSPLMIYIVLLTTTLLLKDNKPNVFVANHYMFMLTYMGRFFEFYMGTVLAMRFMKGKTSGRKNGNYTYYGLAGILLVILCIGGTLLLHGTIRLMATQMLFNIALPLPVVVFYRGLCTENTAVSRLLSGNLMNLFGKSSYTFYLLHMLIIGPTHAFTNLFSGIRYDILVISEFFITLILSIIIYLLFEHPANLHIKRLLLPRENTMKYENI